MSLFLKKKGVDEDKTLGTLLLSHCTVSVNSAIS